MGVSDLDGLVTGIACLSEEFSRDVWMVTALGDTNAVPNDRDAP